MEGNFQLTDRTAVRTLAKIEYDPTKEGNPELRKTRYKIVGSILRLVPSPEILRDLPEGSELQDIRDLV
ncbi:hypothetical protein NMY22_g7955 [Coprinellus aureogranulatus]|nr:hypothetical protein NMY22_g7955 [Coprinellus aureogranulatus]